MKENIKVRLAELPVPDTKNYLPKIIKADDTEALSVLLNRFQPTLHDTIGSQIKELFKIRFPHQPQTAEDLDEKYQEWLKANNADTYGNYVYYPWSNRLVHLVGEEEFIELRTSRNKYKITQEEQETLKTKVVGVIGLSVGQSVALSLAMERVGGTIRLADFDDLELTNLNRIRTGVHSLGLSKAVMTAREIAEIDPYLKVEIFSNGINEENIEEFINENGKLDLVVEVCDSLPIKILSRLKARESRVPVLMDTSDRAMIDIERFDKEPKRELLHGKCNINDISQLNNLTAQERMNLLQQMVDFENLSDKMKLSFSELGKTITTWPQLASDVITGGGLSTKLSRRLLLGEDIASGRYYLDRTEEI